MKDYKPLTISIIIILAIWTFSFIILSILFKKPLNMGEFGDSFGAVNSLFSGIAFAGIIMTIIMQRKELKLQREELELTRNELRKSADAQDASQKALNLQVELMTKQAILNAYQTSFSTNLDLLASRYGTNEQRMDASKENSVLVAKIKETIDDIEKLKNEA